jgi:hypothetical protein
VRRYLVLNEEGDKPNLLHCLLSSTPHFQGVGQVVPSVPTFAGRNAPMGGDFDYSRRRGWFAVGK